MGWDADQQAAAPPADRDGSGPRAAAEAPGAGGEDSGRLAAAVARARRLAQAILDSDEATVEEAVLRLSRSRRLFAPLALAVGAVIILFDGLKLLFSNWRLTLIQVLPAMWIWAAMYDLKAHVLYGKTYHVVTGPARAAIVLAITVITAASFFLNAVFAFAISKPGPPQIRPAFHEARSHMAVVLGSGAVVGLCLGLSTVVLLRWGLWWFALALSIVIGVMMVSYVAVPARLIETGQADRQRRGRGHRGRGLHPAVPARPRGAAHARIAGAAHPGHRRVPDRADVAGGHHQRGQGGQAGRQAHVRAPAALR